MESKNILITGGTGLVGTRLTEMLIKKGYKVSYVSRKEDLTDNIKKYKWNPEAQEMDIHSLENVQYIINLAGAGVADKRWTDARKKEILNSRVDSAKLLFDTLKNNKNSVKAVVSASAIGYYGFSENGELFDENNQPAEDFLGKVTQLWEKEVDKISTLDIRVAKLRIGVVLAKNGGALPQMALPIKLFVGSPLGSGQQIVSWIDLDDLCQMFIYAIENETITGAYNAVATKPVTNAELTQKIAQVLHRPVWPIKVPSFFLKLAVGEMQVVVTGSCHVSNKRITQETDFKYEFEDLGKSLKKNLE